MSILKVIQYYWPENILITDLAPASKDKGHEIVVLTVIPNYPSEKLYEGYSWQKNRREKNNGISFFRVLQFIFRKVKLGN
ncbi:MAG: colanic acid biosynthesis glycosyl transferase WcaI [Oleiphilaceae bacterium]